MKAYLTQRRLDLLCGLGIFALCAGVGFLVVGRGLLSLRAAIRENKILNEQVIDSRQMQTTLAQGTELRDRLQQENTQLSSRFKAEQGFDSFYAQIIKQASDEGLELRGASAETAVATAGFQRRPVHLQLTGSFPEFYRFLGTMFGQDEVIKLESLNVAATDSGQCMFDLTVSLGMLGGPASEKQS